MKNLKELIAEHYIALAAAQALIDQIDNERQALQIHFNTETERLKLETEALEREVKEKATGLNIAQNEARARKAEAQGALALGEALTVNGE